ncbi:MAG: vWA domain-containing protein [Kofleriaceae bacterium]
MTRSLLACVPFVFALTAACGGPKQFGSVCDDPASHPVACDEACDPNAANSCPSGFHCAADGTCDAACTQGGSECGAGSVCSPDGECVPDGSGGPDANCPAVNFTAMPTIPSISLLIDRSGSMDDPIGNKTRYNAVRDALIDPATGVVTSLENKAFFGASLYSTDAPCPKLYSVPRTKGAGTRDSIATLINSQSPEGNTPTGPSIAVAVADFAATPAPAGSPPVIVLATDGLPNGCNGGNGEQASIDAAAAAFAAGIRLFVLAVGNGINDGHLQAVANAGAGVTAGMPDAPFFVANTPADLQSAFTAIIGGVVSCELTISGTIDDTQAAGGTVILNGMTLIFGVDWELVNGNTIRLLGQACTDLKNSPTPMVTASFPCGAVIF